MASLNDLARLKTKVDAAKSERSKAAGALEQVMGRLKKEFGCSTLDDARKMLKKVTADAEKAQTAFDTAFADFEEKYADQLG